MAPLTFAQEVYGHRRNRQPSRLASDVLIHAAERLVYPGMDLPTVDDQDAVDILRRLRNEIRDHDDWITNELEQG